MWTYKLPRTRPVDGSWPVSRCAQASYDQSPVSFFVVLLDDADRGLLLHGTSQANQAATVAFSAIGFWLGELLSNDRLHDVNCRNLRCGYRLPPVRLLASDFPTTRNQQLWALEPRNSAAPVDIIAVVGRGPDYLSIYHQAVRTNPLREPHVVVCSAANYLTDVILAYLATLFYSID